jgi:hypothetical protein
MISVKITRVYSFKRFFFALLIKANTAKSNRRMVLIASFPAYGVE